MLFVRFRRFRGWACILIARRLKYRKGLITEGMFAYTRNPNYLGTCEQAARFKQRIRNQERFLTVAELVVFVRAGEMLLYGSFALLSWHWQPWVFLGIVWGIMFRSNMLAKDASISRYPEWAAYVAQSGLLLPKFPLGHRDRPSSGSKLE